MAVPAHDERDFAFAEKYNLPIKQTIAEKISCEVWTEKKCLVEDGILINS
jgi:leucyl-tRNA synthetase